ncbi:MULTISPECIES: hypothetical protein [unclassified Microcoleus]|uniref:hypothetical protein n=2 Tax=unclassified Microcoleus TaxID=2642155 RepID=UPI0025FE5375|nr:MULTISPECIES: hypothetical protein [unclassified Microcoleus]
MVSRISPQYLMLAGECDRLLDKFSIAFQVFVVGKPSNLAQSQIYNLKSTTEEPSARIQQSQHPVTANSARVR